MRAYIEQINREFKDIVYALAEQDFNRAVDIIRYREKKILDTLKSGIFLMPPKNMSKSDILNKYPCIEDDLRNELDNLATSALTYFNIENGFSSEAVNNDKYLELIVKEIQSANSFFVITGLDIDTGEVKQLTITVENCFSDNTPIAGYFASFLNSQSFNITFTKGK